jgi:hypothetical protein
VGLPTGAQIVDRTSERVIRTTEVYGRLVLRSIRVDRVPMAKAVSVVVANDRLTPLVASQLHSYRVLDNSLATAPIRAPNTNLVWNKIDQPSPIGDATVSHFTFPNSPVPLTVDTPVTYPIQAESVEQRSIVPGSPEPALPAKAMPRTGASTR